MDLINLVLSVIEEMGGMNLALSVIEEMGGM